MENEEKKWRWKIWTFVLYTFRSSCFVCKNFNLSSFQMWKNFLNIINGWEDMAEQSCLETSKNAPKQSFFGVFGQFW